MDGEGMGWDVRSMYPLPTIATVCTTKVLSNQYKYFSYSRCSFLFPADVCSTASSLAAQLPKEPAPPLLNGSLGLEIPATLVPL